MRNSAFELLRKSIIETNQLLEINYVGDKVFETAKNDTIILSIGKEKKKKLFTKLIESSTTQTEIIKSNT